MADATLGQGLGAIADKHENPFRAILDRMWRAIAASQQAKADREIERAIKNYDDAYLRSLGFKREDIVSLRNRA